jgi:hypothetical protein
MAIAFKHLLPCDLRFLTHSLWRSSRHKYLMIMLPYFPAVTTYHISVTHTLQMYCRCTPFVQLITLPTLYASEKITKHHWHGSGLNMSAQVHILAKRVCSKAWGQTKLSPVQVQNKIIYGHSYIWKRISLSSCWEEYIMAGCDAGLEVCASLTKLLGAERQLQLMCFVMLTKQNIT